MNESCATCKYWEGDLADEVRSCRRYPPQFRGGFRPDPDRYNSTWGESFPKTFAEDWCGEYKKATSSRGRPAKKPVDDKPDDFEQKFWAIYPRRDSKLDGRKAWDQVVVEGKVPVDDVIKGLKRSVNTWKSEGRARKVIPLPATWLRGMRWQDEASPSNCNDKDIKAPPAEAEPSGEPILQCPRCLSKYVKSKAPHSVKDGLPRCRNYGCTMEDVKLEEIR